MDNTYAFKIPGATVSITVTPDEVAVSQETIQANVKEVLAEPVVVPEAVPEAAPEQVTAEVVTPA